MTDSPTNPYVGPRPFERKDSARFFGRDQEAHELLSLIVANRVVVLYASSGAGKTSLLNAQVAPLLETEGFELWPFTRVHGPKPVGIAPEDISNIYAFQALFSWAGATADLAALGQQTVGDYLAQFPHPTDETGYERPRVIIFDQFEELFTAYPAHWPERESFLNQVARALDRDPLLRVLFSLREDYLAQLDPYAHLLPRNLGVRFRLERMRPDTALAAIRGPLRQTERNFAPGVAEQLVEDLRLVRVETAGGTQTVKGEFIEPVQLQVVCQNLWEDLPAGVTTITEQHLHTFGNIDQALAAFYARAVGRALPLAGVDEASLRHWFEAALITPAGTRGTVYRGAQQTEGIANTAVETLENMHLIRGEFRAGSRWYELTHDRLIAPIQQSNQRWREARQTGRIKRIRQGALVAVITIAMFAFLLLFWQQLNAPEPVESATVRETATAYVAGVEATAIVVLSTTTAQEVTMVEAQDAVAIANATATAAIATSTWEALLRETEAAQTAVAQQATETAVAQAFAEATATAAVVIPTSTAAAMEATRTAVEFERVRLPVRPLQPGLSIGSQNSLTAGTLSAFVQDGQGNFYLLGPAFALGAADALVWQPSPIDGGRPEDAVAMPAGRASAGASTIVPAALLLNVAQLQPGIAFQTTVPHIGPIVGVRAPVWGASVWVYGRTSGLVERVVGCVGSCPATAADGAAVNAGFLLDTPLASGDEGALVLDGDGYALGVVVANSADAALAAEMTAVLAQFNVELIIAGQQLANFQLRSSIQTVAFSPDGKWFAVGGEDSIVRVWDLTTPQSAPIILDDHTNSVKSVHFTPDSKLLITGSWDRTIRLWDLVNLSEEPLVVVDHTGLIQSLAVSSNGRWLASGTLNNTIQLWDMNDLESEPIILRGHTEPVWSIAFSPDGQTLASGSLDNTVRLWDVFATTSRQALDLNTSQILTGHNGDVLSVAFSPDGQWLASSGNEIIIWDLKDSETEPRVIRGTETVRALSFSPDSQTLATGSDAGSITLWPVGSTRTGESRVIDAHNDWIFDLSFNPDGVRLASGSADGTVKIWLTR